MWPIERPQAHNVTVCYASLPVRHEETGAFFSSPPVPPQCTPEGRRSGGANRRRRADGETSPATDQPPPEGIPWFLDLISLYSWGSQGRPGWEAGNLLPWGSCLRG